MNSTTAEHSFGSTSQPAGFLQLFRIAEIHLLSLCPGTDSHESRRERPPCLISPSAIHLVFSSLLSSHATQPPAPSSSITAGLGILSLIFWSFQPFHQHVVPLFPSLATFLYTLELWGCEFKLAKIMKSSFPSTCSPFSSDFKPWEWHTVLLYHPLIPLRSTEFLNCRTCKPNFSYLEKKSQITKLISLQ